MLYLSMGEIINLHNTKFNFNLIQFLKSDLYLYSCNTHWTWPLLSIVTTMVNEGGDSQASLVLHRSTCNEYVSMM